jgi:hypothetical protein
MFAPTRAHTPRPRDLRRVVLGVLVCCQIACGADQERARRHDAIARIGDETLYGSVVEHVAARDGVDLEEARQRVADVLRLVAAARARQDGVDDPIDLVSPHRVRHLERAARARLWLETDFEARHRPSDIPADDPRLQAMRTSPKFIHPVVHMVCQLIAMPPVDLERSDAEALAEDPAWRKRAQAVFEPVADRMRRHLPEGDADLCKLMQQWVHLEKPGDDVRFRVESGGFDLEACAQVGENGECKTPAFSPRWTEPVSRAQGAGFLPPFFTEFGLHLVYVIDILPARSLDDPDTDTFLRETAHAGWQQEAFATYVQRLREKRTVRLAPPSALGDNDDPPPGTP